LGATKLKNAANLQNNKHQIYYKMFERISPFYLIASVVVCISKYYVYTHKFRFVDKSALTRLYWLIGFCLAFLLYKIIKVFVFKIDLFGNKYYDFLDYLIYIILISFISINTNVGNWLLIAILQLIIIICLTRGLKKGLSMLGLSFAIHISIYC